MRIVPVYSLLLISLFFGCNKNVRNITEQNKTEIKEVMRSIENNIQMMKFLEGALSTATKHLVKARDLAIQSANGIYTREDRQSLNFEFIVYLDEISRIFEESHYNQLYLMHSKHKSWLDEVFVVTDEKGPAISFKLMKLDLTVFGLFAPKTPGKKYYSDKYHIPVKPQSKLAHIASPNAARKNIPRLTHALNKLSRYLARTRAWKKRLNYCYQFTIHRMNNNREEMKSLVKQIEKEIYLLTIKGSNSINNVFDREKLQDEYGMLLSELERVRTYYLIISPFTEMDSSKTLMSRLSAEKLRLELSQKINLHKDVEPSTK